MMTKFVRPYQIEDYEAVKGLYFKEELYGGQFDADRDSFERLRNMIQVNPDSILVYEQEGRISGTVSLVENGRVAFLFRFAILKGHDEKEVAGALYQEGCRILHALGHHQVLVYSPVGNGELAQRYRDLGMNEGNAFTCFWANTEI